MKGDRELPNPPANLVRREEAHAYPTNFNAKKLIRDLRKTAGRDLGQASGIRI